MSEACPLCGASAAAVLHAGVRPLGLTAPSRFDIVACAGCGLRRTAPPPTAAELQRAYGEAYTWREQGGLVAGAEAVYRRLLVRLDQVRAVRRAARLAAGLRLLDVGCGDGLLVAEARRAGLEAFGVDRPGAPLWRDCDPAWRRAVDIEGLEEPEGKWDVVSLFHVAEHLRRPAELFGRVHRWLRPGGVFVVQVPNCDSWQAALFGARWYGYDVPRHLVHWSAGTLSQALTAQGFRVVEARHVSWRDNGPFWAGCIAPTLDPLMERETAAAGRQRGAAATALRRLAYLLLVWGATPLALAEAAAGRGATVTLLARR